MATQDLEKRVENVEETLQLLATVPARLSGLEGQVGGLVGQVDRLEVRLGGLATQFLQSREEVTLEFSAIHGELHGLRDGQRELREGQQRLDSQMHEGQERLASQMREGDERLGSQMRVLYEDLVERIKWLGEGGAFLGGRS